MSIQRCPNEILDIVFQLLPIQPPDNAPAVVLSTMLTCSRFCAIAKRHLLRVVCLQTAERVNLFAMYLTQLINTGAYDEARHPIEHMAVLGTCRTTQRPWRGQSAVEQEAANILPFIISTVAPGLHSLVIFGYDCQFLPEQVNGLRVRNIVQSSVRFQNLTRLILLEQSIVMLHGEENSLHYCYPRLTSLYTHTRHINLALRTLRDLRFHIIDGSWALYSPIPSEPHIETITIDALTYEKSIMVGGNERQQTRQQYHKRIEDYHTLVKSHSKSLESRVVTTDSPRAGVGSILRAWRDIVQGGSGCWKKEWRPAAL